MATVGNCFAAGLLILITIVFSRNRNFLTKASKYYIVCLALTATSAIFSTLSAIAIQANNSPAQIILFTTLDFAFMLLTTSILTLYLIAKITEHIFDDKYMQLANVFLLICYSFYALILILNLPFGFIFTTNAKGQYVKGFASNLPYMFLIPQILLILFYLINHRKRLSKAVKYALLECMPAITLGVIMNFLYEDLVVLVLIITLIELVFFLAFQRQRMGINKLTKLNDTSAFYIEVNKRVKARQLFKTYLIKIRNLNVIKQHYGHKVGDELLYQFAFALERLFGDGLCYHLNGTVFAVLLPDGSTNTTTKLRDFLEQGIKYIDEQLVFEYILVEYSGRYELSAETLYEKLEYASEAAKEANQKYISCSLDLEANRLRKKYLVNRMQNITVDAGFEIWFQPIYNTNGCTCTSVEVLLRLKEQNGQFISPAEFIPIAEKTGQITSISWFVIEQTCKALAENSELNGIRASINLPMLHLIDPSFENRLNSIIDSYGIDHKRISFEFTERVILENLDVAEKNMRRLTRSGYSFYLDDFGTGYSNFNCVLRLPFRTVKLDSSLISAQERLHTINNPVNMLTDLFHDMGLLVIVEGIETKEMLDQMVEFGVDGIQGYYYAKPMPLPALIEFVTNLKIKD